MSNSPPAGVERDPSVVARPDALNVLLDASAMLIASGSVSDVLSGIVDLARQVIDADAYAVWRTYDASNWRVLASHGLSTSYRTELRTRDRMPPPFHAVSDIDTDDDLRDFAETNKAEGIRSLLVVPLKLHNPIPDGLNGGTITFYWYTPRTFSDLDISYASALANLSAAALNLSELHEQNQREKARLAFLAEASAVLASSLDYETTLQRVARLAVPQIAEWCSVHIVDNGVPTRLVVAHADPAQLVLAQEFSQRYPERIVSERGLGLVLRTGKSEVYPHITDDMLAAAAIDEDHLRLLRQLRLTGSILVPLRTHDDRVVGAIRLLSAGERSFNQDDIALAEDLARRAASAIENAQLHRAVLEQEKNLRLAHTIGKMGSWSWDLIHNQPFWSDEFKTLHGMPVDTPSGYEGGVQLIHPEEREQILAEIARALASSDDHIITEHRAITADGRVLWINSRGRINRDSTGRAISIAGISIDVTERHQAEEAMRRSEKLAAAGRLAATVAHEINNPLESIVNLVYLSRHTPGLPADAAEFLTTADNELTRIAQIVRQTLGFYRESVEPRNSPISQIVSETLEVYRQRIQARSLSCDVSLDAELHASVIPGELKQVMANLISNAVDATEPGGNLRISVERDGERAVITVADSGSGIDDAHLPKIFEPFFTTKSEIGTGLGLWVSKGIIEKQRGAISVNSSTDPDDHGTTITVTLPLA